MTRKFAPTATPLALVASTMRWNRNGMSRLAALVSPIGRSAQKLTPQLEGAIGNVAKMSNAVAPFSMRHRRRGMAHVFKGMKSKSWLERAGTISALVGVLSAGAELIREAQSQSGPEASRRERGSGHDDGQNGSTGERGQEDRSSERRHSQSDDAPTATKTDRDRQSVAKATARAKTAKKRTPPKRSSTTRPTSDRSKASANSGRDTATGD